MSVVAGLGPCTLDGAVRPQGSVLSPACWGAASPRDADAPCRGVRGRSALLAAFPDRCCPQGSPCSLDPGLEPWGQFQPEEGEKRALLGGSSGVLAGTGLRFRGPLWLPWGWSLGSRWKAPGSDDGTLPSTLGGLQ